MRLASCWPFITKRRHGRILDEVIRQVAARDFRHHVELRRLVAESAGLRALLADYERIMTPRQREAVKRRIEQRRSKA